jgi:hypothetical protein
MARVAAKQKDNKYAHLTKLYNEEQEQLVSAPVTETVEFKKEEIKIDRRDILVNVAIVAALFLLAASGYLMNRFI